MKRKLGLSSKIIIGLILGALIGLFINNYFADQFPFIDKYLFNPLGTIFINLILMLVVPLVFFSIALGVASIGDPKKMGRIGGKSLTYFLFTAAIALIIAVSLTLLLKPGKVGVFNTDNLEFNASTKTVDLGENFLNIIPTNPIQSMAEGNMLQIIVFAIFIGIGMAMLGKKVEGVYNFFEQANEIMMYLIRLVMKFAPYGTFGLIASAVGEAGFNAMKAMGLYMIVVVIALAVQFFGVYGGTLKLLAKMSPWKFYKAYLPAMSVAFSTSSSTATLPVAMDIAQNKLGVPKNISNFVQPLGAAINMDGTAILQGCATVFIAQVMGVDLTFIELITVIVMALLASLGTASVPGFGLIMLAMVLTSVNLPVEGIALILGVDRILDMTRTIVNSSADAVCAIIITESEKRREAKLQRKGIVASTEQDREAI